MSILDKGNLLIVDLESCNTTLVKYNKEANQPSLKNGLLNSQLCARNINGNDAKFPCNGNKGGPLFINEARNGLSTIVGVISFTFGCGGDTPGIYTRIASYADWIENIVWPK